MRTRTALTIGLLSAAGLALGLALAAQGQPRNASVVNTGANLPWIWEVEFTLHDEAFNSAQKVRRTTRLGQMHYFVNALPDMYLRPTDLGGSLDVMIDAGTGSKSWKAGPASGVTLPLQYGSGRRELMVGRKIVVDDCLDLLNVETSGSRTVGAQRTSPDNTFVISNELRWKTANGILRAGPVSTPYTLDDASIEMTMTEMTVPYDFRVLQNAKQGYTLPPVNFAGYQQVKRTIDYRIKRKPMNLKYVYPPPDVLKTVGLNCENCTSETKNYGTLTETISVQGQRRTVKSKRYLHNDVEINLLIDGTDIRLPSTDPNYVRYPFDILRIRRDWAAYYDKDKRAWSPLKAEQPENTERRLVNDWILDPSGKGNFRDAPGLRMYNEPGAWDPELQVQEFLVGVQGYPEFGFLSYAVAVETRKGGYRAGQTNAKHISAEDFCLGLMSTPTVPVVPMQGWEVARD